MNSNKFTYLTMSFIVLSASGFIQTGYSLDIPIDLADNDKFSKLGNTIETLFNKPENIICDKPAFPDQIVEDRCDLLALVQYESNSTVLMKSPYASYAGAAIDLVKELGYHLESFTPATLENDYSIVMSK